MNNEDLEKLRIKQNWTPAMIYIHRTRMVYGFITGLLVGISIGVLLFKS